MSEKPIGYHVGCLIDGTGEPALKNRIICIKDGYIQQIVDAKASTPPGMVVVDLCHLTVMPTLVDSHVHLVMSGTTDMAVRQHQLENTYEERRGIIRRHLNQHFAHGVMAVRDGGDHFAHVLRYKNEEQKSETPSVGIASAGRAYHAAGRYGKLIGLPVENESRLVQSAFKVDPERDHLKLVNSGLNSLKRFGVETAPQFSRQELAKAIGMARRHGQPTMVHANGKAPVKAAIEAGCTSLEHGFFMGRENLSRMADTGVVWVPTAVTMKAYGDWLASNKNEDDSAMADVAYRNLEHQMDQIRTAHELGVNVALGTDAGSTGVHHGKAVREELGLLIQAGFSIEAAIKCATRTGATLMQLMDRGAILPGMRADFIVVKGSVENVPKALESIEGLFIAGKKISLPGT